MSLMPSFRYEPSIQKFESPDTHTPRWGQRDALPSHFSSRVCPFHGLFSAIFATFLCFLLLILLCKMAAKRGGEVLSRVPKCEKAVMWLTKKIYVWEKDIQMVMLMQKWYMDILIPPHPKCASKTTCLMCPAGKSTIHILTITKAR